MRYPKMQIYLTGKFPHFIINIIHKKNTASGTWDILPRCAIFKILLENSYPESHELENKLHKQTHQYAEMQADIV